MSPPPTRRLTYPVGLHRHQRDPLPALRTSENLGAPPRQPQRQRDRTIGTTDLSKPEFANAAHGLRRTNEDKRRAVAGMLAEVPSWSDRAIAKHVGVSDFMVRQYRETSLRGSRSEPTERTYTTKHGTQATMNVTGQQQAAKERAAPPAPAAAPAPTATQAPHSAPKRHASGRRGRACAGVALTRVSLRSKLCVLAMPLTVIG